MTLWSNNFKAAPRSRQAIDVNCLSTDETRLHPPNTRHPLSPRKLDISMLQLAMPCIANVIEIPRGSSMSWPYNIVAEGYNWAIAMVWRRLDG